MSRSDRRDEGARLDSALHDPLLLNSLRSEDARRSIRQRWAVLLGGLLIAMLVGGFAIRATMAGKADSLATEGWSLWKAQSYTEAEEKFTEATKEDPKSENAWSGLGWSRFGQGKYPQAVEAFRKCLELAPKHPAALNGVGQCLLAQRKYDEAEKALLEAAPTAEAAWHGLGTVYLLKGDFKKAETWWQKIANQQPRNDLAARLLAASKAGSLSDELRAMIEPPGLPEPGATNGWALLNQGKMKEAREAFEAALKKSPDDLGAANGLGFTLLNLGEWDKAKPYFEQCLKANKSHAGAMNGLARCLHAEGKTDEAIALWEKLDRDFPGPNAGTTFLAQTWVERGEHAKAIPYIEKLLAEEPANEMYKEWLDNAKAGVAKKDQ